MSKYLSIFFLTFFASAILCVMFFNVFDGGNYIETAIYAFGTVMLILLSFLISLMYYLINLVNLKQRKF